ncbi:hypothetical protein [Dyella lutea]|uniref:DUF4376 domain-containing protein n=1 Tax=Dyella lutea TaxID=2950441 RepID=A0ABT1FG61_9GAMM|nr:hypothetical protein [Dyella lutea]MCP1375403.1 hypothetical protein [Dyella lutea]
MTIYYNPADGAFYDSGISKVPAGAIQITPQQHQQLLTALYANGTIEVGADGIPVAVAAPAQTLPEVQAQLCQAIDAVADTVYMSIGGPSPGRLAEYQQAQTEATAFKDAGYAGAVPPTVQCWATAKGWTGQQACDDILATAQQWMGALQAIRSARLLGKQSVLNAADEASASAAADTAIANLQAISA